VDKKQSYSRKGIRGSSLGWKNRKSQLKGIMHPEQSVKLKGFSFMFILNTRRTQGTFSGKDFNAPGCPRTGSHFFLLAFSAALVAFPATSLGVVAPVLKICFGPPTAESKNLKNHVNFDVGDLFFRSPALWSSQNVFGPATAGRVVVDFKDRDHSNGLQFRRQHETEAIFLKESKLL